MFLVFNPTCTSEAGVEIGGVSLPAHGASGPGHVAFRVPSAALPAWKARLANAGLAIEAEIDWPDGGRSFYVRDPAGNSVEFASPEVWDLSEAVSPAV
jgi:catechol 2,3-dioxygenase-like lactoylglutathione lyase family enzyme